MLDDIKEYAKASEWIYRSPYVCDSRIDFNAVEKALGFRLFSWQKSYILEKTFRQMGQTTAEILQMLFDEEQYDKPIDFSKPPSEYRQYIFRQQFKEIWNKLHVAGINMRPVFWSTEDKKNYKVLGKPSYTDYSNSISINVEDK